MAEPASPPTTANSQRPSVRAIWHDTTAGLSVAGLLLHKHWHTPVSPTCHHKLALLRCLPACSAMACSERVVSPSYLPPRLPPSFWLPPLFPVERQPCVANDHGYRTGDDHRRTLPASWHGKNGKRDAISLPSPFARLTAGLAIVIIVKQCSEIINVRIEANNLLGLVMGMVNHFDHWNQASIVTAAVALGILFSLNALDGCQGVLSSSCWALQLANG